MEDARKGVCYAGYWKAYGNEQMARQTSERYKKCTEDYRKRMNMGYSLEQLTVQTGTGLKSRKAVT
nr:DUF3793 family protein [Lachnospiraceae bacterium]